MVSSSEAFEKFSIWNKRRTSLRLTLIERGHPEESFIGFIDAIDPDAMQVGFCSRKPSTLETFDVEQAEFSWEPKRMVVSRDDMDWLIFEEEV